MSRNRWPEWAKAIALLASPPDEGVGDTVKRLAGQPGELWMSVRKRLGIPCRCPERRARWNAAYPYAKTTEASSA